jgi:hypothetical protein
LPEQLTLPFGDKADAEPRGGGTRLSKVQRISWARLLERTMDFDMETCPDCGAVMKIEGFVLDPEEIALALDDHPEAEDDAARTSHPPRGPPLPSQLWFDFAVPKRAPRREPTCLAPGSRSRGYLLFAAEVLVCLEAEK